MLRRLFLIGALALIGCAEESSDEPYDMFAPPEGATELPPPEEAPEEAPKEEAEAAKEPQTISITVGHVEGKVKINGKKAKKGQAVKAGDSIDARKGKLDLYWSDGSKVRIYNKTKVKVKSVDTGVSLKLLLGKLYSLINSGTQYEISAKNAVAGVRGTKFMFEEKKKSSYVCVCEGSVYTKGPKDKKETIVEAGFDLWVKKKKAKKPKESPAMTKMTNAEFDDMLSKVDAK